MIHTFTNNNRHFVLDTYSGAVHVVDEMVARMLALLTPPLPAHCPDELLRQLAAEYTAEQLTAAYQELYTLQQEQLLFAPDSYGTLAENLGEAPVKAMCLHIAHDCNLRCKYCFAATGHFGGGRTLMDAETARKAVDFLVQHSAGRHNLELDFFGGEPMLGFDVVRQTVEYARSLEAQAGKRFRFTITTNCMLLDDDSISFINKEMSNVVLSLDGRPGVNDAMRICPDGSGSYEAVVENCRRLLEHRGYRDYYVRGTFTKWNLDFAEDVLHLANQGFDQLSIEPAICPSERPYALTEADLPVIFAEYDRLAERMANPRPGDKPFNFFHFMLDLNQGPCAVKRLRGCGSGNEYVAITPEGDIYPCHQFVGIEEYRMGNLHEGSFNPTLKADFARASVYDKPDCAGCWAKFYCSGGCNANNYLYAGNIRKPHTLACELEKKRIECAIALQAAQQEAACGV